MSQETLILKLAQYYLQERKARAMSSIKQALLKWGLLYFALLFFFLAFVGVCLSGYLWLEPQLGNLNAAMLLTASITGLGVLSVILAKSVGRSTKSPTNTPDLSELCTQLCKDMDVDEIISKHGWKILASLFILGFLSTKCKRK